ncbi:MAG TPA: hypothetical protein VMM35_10905 [Longimicrobiales bacterium]|nr:hypothetical protein [Longimicrobiales bacterium]
MIVIVRLFFLGRMLEKDEVIDAATLIALRELRERFEQSRQSPGR